MGGAATIASMTTVWGHVDGREITFPFDVTDANIATIGYTVDAKVASSLIPGDRFEVIEIGPGAAQLVIAIADYAENPWGDYNEINLGLLARPTGQPEAMGTFLYRMPVDQEFTCKAGNAVMGFPKTVEEIAIGYQADRVDVVLTCAGTMAFEVSFPRAAAAGDAPRVDADAYSYLDGRAYATPLSMDMGTGTIDPADVDLRLGAGPIADEFRALGLPRTPDFAAWGEHLTATFDLGQPLDAG